MKLKDYIFCDDIRQEALKKNSLMGIYNDRVKIQLAPDAKVEWPLPMRLCCFIRVEFEKNETIPDSFSFEYFMNGKAMGSGGPAEGQLRLNGGSSVATISIVGQLPLELGTIGFSVSFKKDGKTKASIAVPDALQVEVETIKFPASQ